MRRNLNVGMSAVVVAVEVEVAVVVALRGRICRGLAMPGMRVGRSRLNLIPGRGSRRRLCIGRDVAVDAGVVVVVCCAARLEGTARDRCCRTSFWLSR